MGDVYEPIFLSKIVQKRALHSNANRLSRRTYEPTEVPTPTSTDALMDYNFVNAVDLRMSERDFNKISVQLANENKAYYRFWSELQYYTGTIETEEATLSNLNMDGPSVAYRRRYK